MIARSQKSNVPCASTGSFNVGDIEISRIAYRLWSGLRSPSSDFDSCKLKSPSSRRTKPDR
jgi:hypothetical protein